MHFVGKHDYALDRKRVPIPPAYREAFAEGGFVTTGIGPFLVLHTEESWGRACEVIEAVPLETEEGSDVHRDFFGNAAPIAPDGQGRVQLPDPLIEHAGLNKDVRVVGTGSRLEIWDKDTFEAREPQTQATRRTTIGRSQPEPETEEEE